MGEVVSYTKDGIDSALAATISSVSISGSDLIFTRVDGAIITVALPEQEVTQAELEAAVAALVDSSPDMLNTLNELAAALGDDPNFAASMTAALAGKIDETEKGAVDGVATLDSTQRVPMTQLNLVNIMGVQNHGTDPNMARPAGFGSVYWLGTAEPVNATEADLWAEV